MDLTLKYAFVSFGGEDFQSYRVGDGGVQAIRWRSDNFLFVIYEDRASILNLNQARFMEMVEANGKSDAAKETR